MENFLEFLAESRNTKELVSNLYNIGDKIKINHMAGEDRYDGKVGTLEMIDDAGQLHGTWGGCALILGVDDFEKID